ncbi:enterotoxin A family protein [Flavobacterium branchiophilum]|uniref:Probable toxin n=1 Tax=Flavobacterium branchiophilum (strain FL-15) TaxID=1034807 RepID=G2Z7B4_FLABF|nr:toxin [Flavobacterium branchiophilum]CCB69019.1 Probable toxin precursor [Flavobacterium branchiophilum FL-15]
MKNVFNLKLQYYTVLLFFLLPLFVVAQPSGKEVPTDGTYIYRVDWRSPKEIKKAGGFRSWALENHLPAAQINWSIYDHVNNAQAGRLDSPYVSFSQTMRAAGTVARSLVAMNPSRRTIYIYVVAPTTYSSVPVNPTVQSYTPTSGFLEVVEMMNVEWPRVLSAYRVSTDNLNEWTYLPFDSFEMPQRNGIGAPAFLLAGFPPGHVAWNQEPWASTNEAVLCRVNSN